MEVLHGNGLFNPLKYIRVERRYSEETAAAYQEDIQAFNDFLTANGGAKAYTRMTGWTLTSIKSFIAGARPTIQLLGKFQACGRSITFERMI